MTYAATRSPDFLFLCGGGIIAHPDGPAAGVASLLAAWEAVQGRRGARSRRGARAANCSARSTSSARRSG